jgi:GTP cyclohydrolase I
MTKITTQQAQEAIKTLLQYIGENPEREGLIDTPKRVIKSYAELFAGYNLKPEDILATKFADISDYDEVVMLKDIEFTSFCEHHMLPFYGTVDIAYMPQHEVIGVSKLARLVDIFAKRLQIQERMTADVANSLQAGLNPLGVAVRIRAKHSCMSARGVHKLGSVLETVFFTGIYSHDSQKRSEFLAR